MTSLTMMIHTIAGAIDMAESELQYGHDKRVKRLAQEIIVTQESEIQLMRCISRTHVIEKGIKCSPSRGSARLFLQ